MREDLPDTTMLGFTYTLVYAQPEFIITVSTAVLSHSHTHTRARVQVFILGKKSGNKVCKGLIPKLKISRETT